MAKYHKKIKEKVIDALQMSVTNTLSALSSKLCVDNVEKFRSWFILDPFYKLTSITQIVMMPVH